MATATLFPAVMTFAIAVSLEHRAIKSSPIRGMSMMMVSDLDSSSSDSSGASGELLFMFNEV